MNKWPVWDWAPPSQAAFYLKVPQLDMEGSQSILF